MSNTKIKAQAIQEQFLAQLRREHVPVSVFLVNGIKLTGQVHAYDQFVVVLKNSVSQIIYKHAISTIVPSRVVELGESVTEPMDEGVAIEETDEEADD